jgi:hypothetical protein
MSVNSVDAFPLNEHEVRYVRKQVRHLLTDEGLVDWRKHAAYWMPDWGQLTAQRKAELNALAETFVRPRVKS